MNEKRIYSIPSRFRKVENMHILLWLIKDACWALNFRTLGMIMIIPTLFVAILITWQTRKMISELLHNLAVCFWITANCLWMFGEFYGYDENVWGEVGLRQLALVPFLTGLLILAIYYLVILPSPRYRAQIERRQQEMLQEEILQGEPPNQRP